MNADDGTGMTKLAVIDADRRHLAQVHVASSIATYHFDCECRSVVGIGREPTDDDRRDRRVRDR